MKKASKITIAVLVLSVLLTSFAFAETTESNWGGVSANNFDGRL